MAPDPAIGSEFFERETELNLLIKRSNAFKEGYRQNMALLGPPAVGKSLLLQKFLLLSKDPECIPIYVEVPQGSLELFVKRFMGGCLTGILKAKNEFLPWDVTELIQKAKKYIPKTVRHMRAALRLVNLSRYDEAYREVIALPRFLREEAGTKAVLILDSFFELNTLPLRDPFAALGKEIMVDKDTMYIVASSKPVSAKKIFREKLNLLFGNFEMLDVKNFDFESASKIIQNVLGAFQISPADENFLIQLTDAQPFYLKTILGRVRTLLKSLEQSVVTREIIFEAIILEVLEATGTIHQHFRLLTSIPVRTKSNLTALQVLTAIALGHRKINKLAQFLKSKIVDVQRITQKLLDEEIIEKDGIIFLIPDSLFRFWLRHVVNINYLGFEPDLSRRREYFKQELLTYYGVCSEERTKDLPKRVEELFRYFSGETISIGNSKILCPSFQEILSKPTNGRVFPVFARSNKGSWLCQIASTAVKEDDIRLFQQDLKSQRTKIQKRVVVALSGIDLNATLMAKDAKINIWDLKNFNRLLEIYDRPKVII